MDYYLKASRLIGEIQQLAVLIHLQTEMGCEVRFHSHVEEFEFYFAPNKEMFVKRYGELPPEQLIVTEFYVGLNWNETGLKQQKTLKKLMRIKRMLVNSLKEKNIDYGKLDYTIETIEYKQYVI
ncbi:hypothetical protein NiCM35_18345 [Niallia circulans]|uniref:hypothetical protein n=1 Tax=Niallia circulans TaxID=1397 RepID=UPI003D9883DB